MDVETCVTLRQKIFFIFFWPFFGIFLTLLSTQTKKLSIYFFSMSWPWKIGLWICISSLYIFSKSFFSGGGGRPPRLYIDSDLPAFIGLIFGFSSSSSEVESNQGIGIKGREMTLVWHEKASRTALQTSSV